jgi:hypothetical protein
MQKGAGHNKCIPESLIPDCNNRDCDNCHGVARPSYATLLVHDKESLYCFEDYPDRLVFSLEDLGLDHNEFSLACAVRVAQLMGCTKFNFVSCDAHATGDLGTAFPEIERWDDDYYKWAYGTQKELMPKYIGGLDCKWITPAKR